MNDELLKRYAGGFDKAVRQVFKNTSDFTGRLRINAARFGTFKTYSLCRILEAAREQRMPLAEFKKFAKVKIGVYNGYQRTEYNTLVARSRTAKQFRQAEKDIDLYPCLEWLATRSANPRIEHAGYVGLILPVNDPFWNTNQPGNEYNCKCDWRQTAKQPTGKPARTVIPAKGLEGNPAKTAELITRTHPYFARNANAPAWISDKALLQLPDEVAFIKKTTPDGKTFLEHRLVEKTHEANDNRIFAQLLLQNGYNNVKLLPKIKETEIGLRVRYLGKDYVKLHPKLNPDAIADDKFIEFKNSNIKQFTMRIGMASKQSNVVFIKLTEEMPTHTLEFKIKKQWDMQDRKNLERIIVYNSGQFYMFDRK